MTTDDRYGTTGSQSQGSMGQSQTGQSQTGTTPGQARSPEYDDGRTARDAAPPEFARGVGNDQVQPGTSTMGRGVEGEHGTIGESGSGEQGRYTPGPSAQGGSTREGSGEWSNAGSGATAGGMSGGAMGGSAGSGSTSTARGGGTTSGSMGGSGAASGSNLGGSHHDLGDNRDGLGRDRTDDVTADETGTLISADKVVGTAVYDASGERLGTINSIMLNKRSGKVAYAVMSFGGFLGIGERYHPLPWNVLTYDERKSGYNIQHSADDLRRAPNYSRDEVSAFDGGTQQRRDVNSYYGVEIGRGAGDAEGALDSTRAGIGAPATGVEAADAVGSTTGAGSTGMGSTGMGANRNY